MWRLQDAHRHTRRVSATAHLAHLTAHHHHRERHPLLRPHPQPTSASTRRMLLTWLYRTSKTLCLHPCTPILAASYLDRLLSHPVSPPRLPHLQPLAAAALRLAIKFHEVGGDAIDVYDRIPVPVPLPDELAALDSLHWHLVSPTAYTFLHLFALRVWLPPPALAAAHAHLRHALLCTSIHPSPTLPPPRTIVTPLTRFRHTPSFPSSSSRVACLPPLRSSPGLHPAAQPRSSASRAVQTPGPAHRTRICRARAPGCNGPALLFGKVSPAGRLANPVRTLRCRVERARQFRIRRFRVYRVPAVGVHG